MGKRRYDSQSSSPSSDSSTRPHIQRRRCHSQESEEQLEISDYTNKSEGEADKAIKLDRQRDNLTRDQKGLLQPVGKSAHPEGHRFILTQQEIENVPAEKSGNEEQPLPQPPVQVRPLGMRAQLPPMHIPLHTQLPVPNFYEPSHVRPAIYRPPQGQLAGRFYEPPHIQTLMKTPPINLLPIQLRGHEQPHVSLQTRHLAKRVFVTGLLPTTVERLSNFFNARMNDINGLSIPGLPITNVRYRAGQNSAILETRTYQEASNLLVLSGIFFEGARVAIRRPREYDYNEGQHLGAYNPSQIIRWDVVRQLLQLPQM